MIKVLLADDHSIVREGMKHLFSLTNDIQVASEAANGGDVLELLHQPRNFNIILLDMSMPGICGVNLISRIRAHDLKLPILVISMHNEPQIARRALNAGASGYLTKDSEPEILLAAVRKVARGGKFMDPGLAEQMIFQGNNDTDQQPAHEQLSEREFQILSLLAKGKSLNEIADELAISNKTVSTHKARLMQKMEFHSNADLVRYAVEHGLTA